MHNEEKVALKILAAARAAIGESHGHANELDAPERARRVEIHKHQIAAHGRIVDWLPASAVRPAYLSRRTRFATGDALGHRRTG